MMNVAWLYEQLAIGLGHPRHDEAPVRCFAAPEDHQHEDRRPSSSVNLTTGAWFCHGCGRGGGPYDAALLAGRTPRQTMDLLRAAGLADTARSSGCRRSKEHDARETPTPRATATPLAVSKQQIAAWSRALSERPAAAMQMLAIRGWRCRSSRDGRSDGTASD